MLKPVNINKIKDDELVWYAAYGSNLNKRRFLCYVDGVNRIIRGKRMKNPGCLKTNDKCNITGIPLDDRPFNFNQNIYFGERSEITWGGYGAAFISNIEKGFAYGRIYKVTGLVFKTIREQEGVLPMWYGDILKVGVIDGLPVYALTQSSEYNISSRRNSPSEVYLEIMKDGLREIKIEESEVNRYVEDCLKH
jgi:hypothetical protein